VIIILWIILIIASLSALVWLALLFGRGEFWKMDQRLSPLEEEQSGYSWPSITAIIPARNEGETLPDSLPTVLGQDYPGELNVILVNDHSEDDTDEIAGQIAGESDSDRELRVVVPPPTPESWAGKVWALHHGFQHAKEFDPELIWLTDADISHDSETLKTITQKLAEDKLDLVSVMADLQTESFWEKLLIPNFVYYFSMIYPFNWVNDSNKETAAAAGGCVIVRRPVLENLGGFGTISDAVIDDCALAQGCSNPMGEGLWLGLSHMATSIRSYESLGGIWKTVSRSAFSQLRYSNLLLLGTVLGLIILFVVPLASIGLGIGGLLGSPTLDTAMSIALVLIGGTTWFGMGLSLLPILNWYGLSPAYGLLAPVGGIFYTLMTIDSGLTWWRKEGSEWKGRTMPAGRD